MRKFVLSLTLVAAAQSAQAAPIICKGKFPHGPGVFVSANWTTVGRLDNVKVAIQGGPRYGLPYVYASAGYKPRNPVYQGLIAFKVGGDGWANYVLLLDRSPSTTQFVSYFQSNGEAGQGTARLLCQ